MDIAPAHRPSGLVALAIANFLVGGFFMILAVLSLLWWSKTSDEQAAANAASALPALLTAGPVGLLGIITGIGYLGQKRITGKMLGTIFGCVGTIAIPVLLMVRGHDFGVLHAVMLTCFAANIALVNTIFKDAFIRP